jgi:hypothetical protein
MAGSIIFLKTVMVIYGFKEAMDLVYVVEKDSIQLYLCKNEKIVFLRQVVCGR